ncbi:MAG: hypothetical protein ACM3YO_03155 [Bacteroidota bacterium]
MSFGSGALGLGMLVFLATMAPAEAHRPLQIGGIPSPAITIQDPDVSQVIYAELSAPQVDAIRFQGKAGQRIVLQLGVPALVRLKDFQPVLALLGPGLPPAEGLPFETEQGAVVVPFQKAEPFFEHFTRTSSWMAPPFEIALPATGEYFVSVFSRRGSGKYWLAIGEKEVFGVRDWLMLPMTIWNVRRFHEIPTWKDALFLAGTIGVAGLIVVKLRG